MELHGENLPDEVPAQKVVTAHQRVDVETGYLAIFDQWPPADP
jgi:hypothetical protein